MLMAEPAFAKATKSERLSTLEEGETILLLAVHVRLVSDRRHNE
jgi:hypothetical protein